MRPTPFFLKTNVAYLTDSNKNQPLQIVSYIEGATCDGEGGFSCLNLAAYCRLEKNRTFGGIGSVTLKNKTETELKLKP